MKLDFRAVLGIVLSAALLFWTLRGIHLAEVWQVLRSSDLLYFGAATVAAVRRAVEAALRTADDALASGAERREVAGRVIAGLLAAARAQEALR